MCAGLGKYTSKFKYNRVVCFIAFTHSPSVKSTGGSGITFCSIHSFICILANLAIRTASLFSSECRIRRSCSLITLIGSSSSSSFASPPPVVLRELLLVDVSRNDLLSSPCLLITVAKILSKLTVFVAKGILQKKMLQRVDDNRQLNRYW